MNRWIGWIGAALFVAGLLVGSTAHACGAPPTVQLSTLKADVDAGAELTLLVVIGNPDAAPCKAGTVVLSTGSGGGYYPYPDIVIPATLTIEPGDAIHMAVPVTIPAGAPAGTYFNLTVYAARPSCRSPGCSTAAYTLIQVAAAEPPVCLEDTVRDAMCVALGCGYGR